MKDFTGRTAVVTGAAGGIGLGLAQRFVREGMRVVMADWGADALETAAASLRADGAEVLAVPTDVSDVASVEALAEKAASAYGNVHVLCNNAGVMRPGSTFEQSLDDWDAVLSVNLWGVLHGLRAFVPAMLEHGEDGHVVNTSSINGLVTTPQFASYIASKYAVVGMTETLAAELALRSDARIGVSVLCPAGVSTQIFTHELARRASLDTENISGETQQRFAAYADPTRTDKATPDQVAGWVVDAITEQRFYVLPPEPGPAKDAIRARLATLTAALDGDESAVPSVAVQAPGMHAR